MEDQKANDALQAYLSLLKSKGASSRELNVRKHFLRFLISELKDKPCTGDAYRASVDAVLAGFPQNEDLKVLPVCARDFYYFWIGDIKQIALLHATGLIDPNPLIIATQGSLIDMLGEMDRAGWEMNDIPALRQYLADLRANGATDAVIDIRERLIRLLLFVIREHEPTSRAYRAGVDALQGMFQKEEARNTFVTVARDFFYYWLGRVPQQETEAS